MRIGWRLGVTLAFFAAAAAIIHLAPPVKSAANPVSLFALPSTLGMWSGIDGVPEQILPTDPNERLSVRRTYHNGNQVAWVSVALFVGQNDEARRASINKIFPLSGVSLIERGSVAVPLNGSSASPITLPVVFIRQESRQLLVAYWHQIENRVYGNEYRFRLALMLDLIFARRADALLVRIALPAGPTPPSADDLADVAGLASSVYAGLGREFGR